MLTQLLTADAVPVSWNWYQVFKDVTWPAAVAAVAFSPLARAGASWMLERVHSAPPHGAVDRQPVPTVTPEMVANLQVLAEAMQRVVETQERIVASQERISEAQERIGQTQERLLESMQKVLEKLAVLLDRGRRTS